MSELANAKQFDSYLLHLELERHLSEMEKLFKPHCKLTLLMRNPQVADGDLLLTMDDLDEAIAAIERLKGNGS